MQTVALDIRKIRERDDVRFIPNTMIPCIVLVGWKQKDTQIIENNKQKKFCWVPKLELSILLGMWADFKAPMKSQWQLDSPGYGWVFVAVTRQFKTDRCHQNPEHVDIVPSQTALDNGHFNLVGETELQR